MKLEEAFVRIIFWPIAIGFFACLGILVYQCSKFPQIGVWRSISVVDALRYFGSEWAAYLDAWLGVHKILDFLPMSIGAVMLGFLPLAVAILIARSGAS